MMDNDSASSKVVLFLLVAKTEPKRVGCSSKKCSTLNLKSRT